MFVKELGNTAGVPSVYTLPVCMLGQWKLEIEVWKSLSEIKCLVVGLDTRPSKRSDQVLHALCVDRYEPLERDCILNVAESYHGL